MTQPASVARLIAFPASQCSPTGKEAAGNGDDDINLLLLHAGSLDRTHALIVAARGLDLLRALIGRGCLAATCLRPDTRPDAAAYEHAFFPDITPHTPLERIVRNARRALRPGGCLIARIGRDPTDRFARALAHRLKLNGFIGVRLSWSSQCTLLHARLAAERAITAPLPQNPRPAVGATQRLS